MADNPATRIYTVTSRDRHGNAMTGVYQGVAAANSAEALLRDMGHTDIRCDGEYSVHNRPATNPTFQELRDGQTYRLLRDGQTVTVVGPFIPGQPIYIRLADGSHEYTTTRALVKL